VLLVAGTGVLAGATNAWQGVLQSILNPSGIGQRTAGWIGFANGLAGNLSSVAAGLVIARRFRRRLKACLVGALLVFFVAQLAFALALPCALLPKGMAPPLEGSLGSPVGLTTLLVIGGVAQGVTNPITYELAAELIYPVREGMSAGILVCILNGACLVVVLLRSSLSFAWMNVVECGVVGTVLLLILLVREEYRRPADHDSRCSGSAAGPSLEGNAAELTVE
jgi:MFS family permease